MALPALAYGVLHAKIIPALGSDGNADLIFGVPLILKLVAAVIQPNAHAADLLLHPVGRAAWVGFFATALNLLPVGPARRRPHSALGEPARALGRFRCCFR